MTFEQIFKLATGSQDAKIFLYILIVILLYGLYKNQDKIYGWIGKKIDKEEIKDNHLIDLIKNNGFISSMRNFVYYTNPAITMVIFDGIHFSPEEKKKRLWNFKMMAKLNIEAYIKHFEKFFDDIIEAYQKKDTEKLKLHMQLESWTNIYKAAYTEWIVSCEKAKVNKKFIEKFYKYHSKNDTFIMEKLKDVLVTNRLNYTPLEQVYQIAIDMEAMVNMTLNMVEIIACLNSDVSESFKTWEFEEDYLKWGFEV